MTFVSRDENGNIVARFAVRQFQNQEQLPDDHPELQPRAEEVHREKLQALNAEAEAQLAAIRERYPLSEMLSWPKQEAEARAHLEDKGAACPLLSAMAQIRGLTVDELAARVIAKADAYTALVAQVVGMRQKLEEEIAEVASEKEPPREDAPVRGD